MTVSTVSAGATSAEIVGGQKEYLLPSLLHLYSEPLALVEGEGVRVRDAEGREYLDLFSGILTTSVGHCHPRVVEAMTSQMNRLGHVSTLYANKPQVEAAKQLGKSQQFISRSEAGDRRIDALDLADFADLYGQPVAWLLERRS